MAALTPQYFSTALSGTIREHLEELRAWATHSSDRLTQDLMAETLTNLEALLGIDQLQNSPHYLKLVSTLNAFPLRWDTKVSINAFTEAVNAVLDLHGFEADDEYPF